jgi:hypothetical protein
MKITRNWHQGWSYSCDNCGDGLGPNERPVIRIEFEAQFQAATHLCQTCLNQLKQEI